MNDNAKPHYSSRYIIVILCLAFILILTACGNDGKLEVQPEDETTPIPTSTRTIEIANSESSNNNESSDNTFENGGNEDLQGSDDASVVESVPSDPDDQGNMPPDDSSLVESTPSDFDAQENVISNESEEESSSALRSEIDFSTSQEFSLSSSNSTPPEDVLFEVAYSGGFGGGGPLERCTQSYTNPKAIFLLPNGNEDLNHSGIVEWMENFSIYVCGLYGGEKVEITMQSESGEIIYEGVNDNGVGYFNYQVPLNTPYGLYSVIFEGAQGDKVVQNITIAKPTTPRMYAYEDGLLLYNFKPNERIRLLAYGGDDCSGSKSYSLLGWQEYQINDQGYLNVQLGNDVDDVCTFVIPRESGAYPITEYAQHQVVGIYKRYDIVVGRITPEYVAPSLWQLATYRDLKEPGTQTYYVSIPIESEWRWNFSWCADNSALLEEILKPLTIKFLIDGVEIAYPPVQGYDQIPQKGQACRRWGLLLSEWPEKEPIELEIQYTLTESIYDGNESFPPGTYRQIIIVNTNE